MSTGNDGGTTPGAAQDKVLIAYQATPEEERAGFRALFESGLYSDQLIADVLTDRGFDVLVRDVKLFKVKLAKGQVSW